MQIMCENMCRCPASALRPVAPCPIQIAPVPSFNDFKILTSILLENFVRESRRITPDANDVSDYAQ